MNNTRKNGENQNVLTDHEHRITILETDQIGLKPILADIKADLRELRADINSLRKEIKTEINDVRVEFRDDVKELRLELYQQHKLVWFIFKWILASLLSALGALSWLIIKQYLPL